MKSARTKNPTNQTVSGKTNGLGFLFVRDSSSPLAMQMLDESEIAKMKSTKRVNNTPNRKTVVEAKQERIGENELVAKANEEWFLQFQTAEMRTLFENCGCILDAIYNANGKLVCDYDIIAKARIDLLKSGDYGAFEKQALAAWQCDKKAIAVIMESLKWQVGQSACHYLTWVAAAQAIHQHRSEIGFGKLHGSANYDEISIPANADCVTVVSGKKHYPAVTAIRLHDKQSGNYPLHTLCMLSTNEKKKLASMAK